MPNLNDQKVKTVRPDSKGRISLGKRARNYSGYTLMESADGSIVLEPLMEVPAKEAWLFKNREALAGVQRGLKQSAAGKTRSLGSFAKYATDEKE